MTLRFLFLFFLLFNSIFSYGLAKKREISLEKASGLVLKSQNGLETIEKNISLVDLKLSGFDHVFEPKLSFKNIFGYDNSETSKFPKIEKATGYTSDLEMSKLFSTGTVVKTSLGFAYKNAPMASSGTESNPMMDFFSSTYKETSLESKFSIELSQSLLKGWMTREAKLQKSIAKDASIEPKFQKDILSQGLLYEMEILFVNYTNLAHQISKLRESKQILESMFQVMKKQKKLGQADELSLAKFEYRVISLEVKIESLLLQKEELEKTILLKCDLSSEDNSVVELQNFDRKSYFSNAKEAIAFAAKNRLDLKKLTALESPTYKEIDLLKEQSKPNLDLFVRYSANGMKGDFSDSVKSMATQEHPSFVVGLNFSVSLGNKIYTDQYRSKLMSLEILSSRRNDLLAKIKRELEIAFIKLENTKKKRSLNKKIFLSLKKQFALEKTRFTQARGSRLALLASELEIKTLESENLTLKQEEELTISQIKFLTHLY